jgi:hypothetical protein
LIVPGRIPSDQQASRIMSRLNPVFYDFEASAIGGLPVEIGWAFVEEATGAIRSESHLVKPPAHWDLAAVWDPDAQKLHKITPVQLIRNGRTPLQIVSRMNQALSGRRLFSDAPVDDERWLFMIWAESGVPAIKGGERHTIALVEPTFKVRRIHAGKLLRRLALKRGLTPHDFENVKSEASRKAPRIHRADADARNLATLWQIITAAPKRKSVGRT